MEHVNVSGAFGSYNAIVPATFDISYRIANSVFYQQLADASARRIVTCSSECLFLPGVDVNLLLQRKQPAHHVFPIMGTCHPKRIFFECMYVDPLLQ